MDTYFKSAIQQATREILASNFEHWTPLFDVKTCNSYYALEMSYIRHDGSTFQGIIAIKYSREEMAAFICNELPAITRKAYAGEIPETYKDNIPIYVITLDICENTRKGNTYTNHIVVQSPSKTSAKLQAIRHLNLGVNSLIDHIAIQSV